MFVGSDFLKTKTNSASDYQSESIPESTFSSIVTISTSLHFHTAEEKTTALSSRTPYCRTFALVLAGIGLIFS